MWIWYTQRRLQLFPLTCMSVHPRALRLRNTARYHSQQPLVMLTIPCAQMFSVYRHPFTMVVSELNSPSSMIADEHRNRSGNDGKVHVRRMYIMNPKT